MIKKYFNYNEFYNLINSILYNSFGVSANKISNIYEDSNYEYFKFRRAIWPNFDNEHEDNINNIYNLNKGSIGIIKSNLKFITIIITFPSDISDDILIIDPFLEEKPNEDFILNLFNDNNLDKNLLDTISFYYNSLPINNLSTVISILNTILETFIQKYDKSNMYHINFDKNKIELLNFGNRINTEFYDDFYKKYKLYLNEIFSCIKLGKIQEGTKTLKLYLKLIGFSKDISIDKLKHNLYILNSKFESCLLNEKIPTSHIHYMYLKIETLIQYENNKLILEKLPFKILKYYCNLSTNYNLQNYSYTIRNAIEYINLNLDSELSLSSISSYIDKNSSFLSNQFKKETGKTITSYIRERRIEESLRLIHNPELTIQEISQIVGIHDLSYFSKLFKNTTGVSPSQYRLQKSID